MLEWLINFTNDNWKSAIIGLILSPVYFYVIGALFGVGFKGHIQFLVHQLEGKDPLETYKEQLFEDLKQISKQEESYERYSREKAEKIWKFVITNTENQNNSNITDLVNRNYDGIRALAKYREIHIYLLESNDMNDNLGEHLKSMYEGSKLVLRYRNKNDYWDAYEIFNNELLPNIDDFPLTKNKDGNSIRTIVHLELLRNISFLAATLDSPETQHDFTQQALTLAQTINKPYSPVQYIRDYFWMDFSELVYFVNKGNKTRADKFFQRIESNLPGENVFLQTKMLQFDYLIKDENDAKQQWEDYKKALQ